LKVIGELTIVCKDKSGRIKARRKVKNVITNTGKASMAGLLLADVTEPAYDYVAIGTGTTPAAATDTALEFETHREAGTGTLTTVNVTNDTAQLVAIFSGYTGTEAVTEAGMFNDPTAGDMLCRQTFAAINVDWGAGDSIEITWRVTFS